MREMLFAVLLAAEACSGRPHCSPDAFQRDWVWAWDGYADAWCTWYQECDPPGFAQSFGTHERCAADNDDLCDAQLGYMQCREPYPDAKLGTLTQCEDDMRALSCDATVAPDSCGTALTP